MQKPFFKTWGLRLCTVLLFGVVLWALYAFYEAYGIPGVLVFSCFVYAVFGFIRWFREVENISSLKTSDTGCAMLVSEDGRSTGRSEVTSSSIYPNDSSRWIRDRLDHLETAKADKDVIKSENRRLLDKVESVTEEVDEIKARMLTPPQHSCLQTGELAAMKKSLESTIELSKAAMKTANLTSARGFKIILGFIAGLITMGSAALVWAVNVGRTADDAYSLAEKLAKTADSDLPEPQSVKSTPVGLIDPQEPVSSSQVSVDRLLDKAVDEAIRAALERASKNGQLDATPPTLSTFPPSSPSFEP